VLDSDATESSVLANVWFRVSGLSDRVGIRIVSGQRKEEILKATFRYGNPPPHLLLIQSKQRFPAATKVSLVWGKEVASPTQVTNAADQVLPFVSRGPFTATFGCRRENLDAYCVPISPMHVSFSGEVAWDDAKTAVITGPAGRKWTPEPPPDVESEGGFVSQLIFKGPFPERSEFTVQIPTGLKDDSGRALENARSYPLRVHTDEYPPLAKFSAPFGIIELKADAMLPVTLRNVEEEVAASRLKVDGSSPVTERKAEPGDVAGSLKGKIVKIPADKASQMLFWIDKVERRSWEDRDKSVFGPAETARALRFSIPKPAGPKSFEVVGIPMKTPGFYVVEIRSEILGAALLEQSKPMYVPTTALVTNLSVHFKWGNDSSLVWVTTLDKGKPVPQAAVEIQDCQGKILWEGRTDRDGLLRTGLLPDQNVLPRCSYNRFGAGLVVTARVGEDFSFVHTSWEEGIEPWRFQLPMDYRRQPAVAHAILDRSLFRAGETVHMKYVLRRRAIGGFALLPAERDPKSVVISHLGSAQKYEIPLKWDSSGVSEGTWTIPKDAKLGTYVLTMPLASSRAARRSPGADPEPFMDSMDCGSFRVEEFRVPLMKAVIRPPSSPLVAPSNTSVDVAVTYLGGGGAGSLPVKIRSQITGRPAVSFEQFDGFLFSNGRIKEGVTAGEPYEVERPENYPVKTVDLALDKLGTARVVIGDLPKADKPLELVAELEYKDPNGETGTVSSTIPFWPASELVGIKPFSWGLAKDSVKFQVAVVGLGGTPVSGAPVKVDLLERKVYSHRKRLIGGFYAYENSTEVKRVGTVCEGKTDPRGLLFCNPPSPVSGNVILQAVARDDGGREASVWQDVWVAGDHDWWFAGRDDDRIDVIPEKKRYEPGEKAKFQVRMPFRSATALITLEREGVGDAYIRELSAKNPVIEIPVKETYAPNMFVSVLVVRGRAGGVQPTATVDLGRPAYKLGITEINVGWRAHELRVAVGADRPVYKVREKAKVSISVKTPDGKPPGPGGEVAVAAVDEGLLELAPNESWQLLDAMMGRRSYGVQTSTAQMHVVGKRHFGLKALPQGGGGGNQVTRELFDTLLLWKGRLPLDAEGKASLEIPLNDSITSFRIVAVANQADRFGTGKTSIRSTQDLMIFSGISPVVREGDKLVSEFTVRNAADRAMKVEVSANVRELGSPLPPKTVDLAPGEAKELGWNITVPAGVGSLTYELAAREGQSAGDRLRVVAKVVPSVPVRTFQATLEQLSGSMTMSVRMPKDAIPGRGGVRVALIPTLLGSLEGVTEYMHMYPYTCLEQETSRAIALGDSALWNRIMAELPSYLDADGLAKYFPQMRWGSDTLTSYVLAVADEAGWQIPADSRLRMIAALRGFVEGRIIRYSSLPTADLSIRKIAAVEALSRTEKIDPALLASVTIDPNLWPTSAVIDWTNILRAVPAIRNRDVRLREADQILRARLEMQGTTMGFSTERGDCVWWLMVSPDSNAARLVLSLLGSPEWKQDMPRLMRGALGRQKRGHWDTTMANAWGVLATEKYAKAFEHTPVTGKTTVALGGKMQSVDWAGNPAGAAWSFDWPPQTGNLAITMAGAGAPYATVQSLAAIPLSQPLSSGFKITKTVTAIERREPAGWSRGDIVRIRLDCESSGDMTWVVVDDPIPAGATIFGTGLGRDSALAAEGEQRKGWVWPAFEERSFEAFRSYFEFVPKGKWTVEYTLRLNNRGLMHLPPTRAEALYSPEMFGEIPNAPMEIK
jgi:hypothetical protein